MGQDQKQSAQKTRGRELLSSHYLEVDSFKDDNGRLVRRYLLAAVEAAVVLPLLFYLRFGRVSWFAIGCTVFLVVLCLLVALGLFFQNRNAFHTHVPAANNIADRIGAFWLIACTFGPFLGWLMMALPLTVASWRWLYAARVFCAVALPVITAVPLVRYARGKAALIAVPLLLGITSLPVLSCWWVIGDLHDGAMVTSVALSRNALTGQMSCKPVSIEYDFPCAAAMVLRTSTAAQVTWLPHTGRVIEVRKL